jgi:hypothetical protein
MFPTDPGIALIPHDDWTFLGCCRKGGASALSKSRIPASVGPAPHGNYQESIVTAGLKSLCENSCLALARLDPRFRGGDSAGFRGCIPTCHSRESGNPRVFTQTLKPRPSKRVVRNAAQCLMDAMKPEVTVQNEGELCCCNDRPGNGG